MTQAAEHLRQAADHLVHTGGHGGGGRDSVWPDAWKGSYSPPRERTIQPPYPLPESWATPPKDRAPTNPPDVSYPHEAARAAAARAAAVAAHQQQKHVDNEHHHSEAPVPPRGSFNASTAFIAVAQSPGGETKRNERPDAIQPSAQDPARRPSTSHHSLSPRGPRDVYDDNPGSPFDKRERGTLQEEVKKLRAALTACERREAAAERAVSAAEQQAEATALKLKDITTRLQARDAEIRELGHQSVVLREGGAASAAEAEESRRKLSAAHAAVARITNELTDQRHRREALERTAGELTSAVDGVKRDNLALKAKLARAEDDIGRLREKLAAAEEREKLSAVMTGRLTKEGDVARREGQMLRMHNQKGAVENTELASALQAAKQEVVELRQRCKYLEKMALVAATGQAPASQRFQNSPGQVKREQRDARPRQHPSPLKQRPQPSQPTRDEIENTSPRSRKQWQMPAAGRPTAPSQAWGLEEDTATVEDHSQGDHLGMNMVPEAGSDRREDFSAAYGMSHAGLGTSSHLGAGMVPMSASDERSAAEAREAAARRAAYAEAAEMEARRPSTARTHEQSMTAAAAAARAAVVAGAQTARERPSTTSATMATTHPRLETAADRYSASEASRRGRDGSGWYGGLLDGGSSPRRPPAAATRSSDPAPWVLGADVHPRGPAQIPAAPAHARPSHDEAPFATAESFASWSAHVAAVEARLMQLSMEKDALEGELSRMPPGAGKTIDQRRRKKSCEDRLEEVARAQSVARHQLKSANRMHLVGS